MWSFLRSFCCGLWARSCLVALAMFWSAAALAQTSSPTKFDAKLYDPVVNPHGIFGVHTSRTLRHLSFYGQLSLNYANDEVLAQRGDGLERTIVMRPIQHRLTTELGLALGILDRLEFGVSLPLYLQQIRQNFAFDSATGGWKREAGAPQGETLLGDLRLLVKVRLMGNERFGGFGLGVLLELSLPTGSPDALSGDSSVVFTPQLIADYRHKSGFVFALNVGARLRSVQKYFFDDLPISHEVRMALGAEIPLFFSRLSVLGEGIVSLGLEPSQIGKSLSVASELRTGLRWRHDSGVVLTAGVGLGLIGGFGAPDFRFFLDLRFGRNVRTGKADEPWFPDYGTSQPDVIVHGKKPAGRRPPPRRAVVRRAPPRATPRAPPPIKVVVVDDSVFDKAAAADPDPDGDGIPNTKDRCPRKPEDFDGYQDDDGCPELDNDGDGIPDAVDQCPNKPETINGVDDRDGCPDVGKSKVTIVKGVLKIDEKVYFASGSDTLKSRSFSILKQVASFIKANAKIHKILIEGHTDNRGDKEMNVDLAERRARRVLAFLLREGVLRKKLKAKGFGPKVPITTNKTGKGRALNRRVAFRVLGVKAVAPSKGAK